MLAIVSEGDKTTDLSEQTLIADTSNGIYQLKLNRQNLASGETLEVRVKSVLRSGVTARQERLVSMASAPYDDSTDAKSSAVAVFDPPIWADLSVTFTIKQLSGAARVIPWKVLKET